MEPVPGDLEDAELVKRVLAGDRQAFAGLVRRHQNRLRSVLSFYCRAAEEVEEFLQETFVQSYARLHQFDASLPFFPWLRAIAVNFVRMDARRRGSAKAGATGYLHHIQLLQAEEGDGGEAEARGTALKQCLDRLPRPHAELLEAKYHQEHSLAELAARYRTTEGALKVRLLRLRGLLRDCIQRHLPAVAGGA